MLTIYQKIVLLVSAIAIGIGVSVTFILNKVMHDELIADAHFQAQGITGTMGEAITKNVIDGNVLDATNSIQRLLARNPAIVYAFITDFSGKLFSQSFDGSIPDNLRELSEHATKKNRVDMHDATFGKSNVMHVSTPLIQGASGRLSIGFDTSEVKQRANDASLQVLFITLIVTSAGIFAGILVGRRIGKPIADLTQSMKAFGSTDLAHDSFGNSPSGGMEISSLWASFRGMARRVQENAAEIRKLNETLEQRVANRTRKLSEEIAGRIKTERKNLELSRRNEMILNAAGDGIYGIDMDGNCTFINPAACKMLGLKTDDIIGKNQHDIIHHSKADGTPYAKEDCPILSVPRDCVMIDVENEVFWRQDGTHFPGAYTCSPTLNDGKPMGAVITFHDISEQQLREAELNSAKVDAENANQAKSAFLSNMSHELRTPMNAILGFSQILETDKKNPLTENQQNCVGHILSSGNHLLTLINDILDLSKIEAGKLSLSIEPINPLDVFDECTTLVRSMAEMRGIHLISGSTLHPKTTVMSDYTRLKQVLLNLLSNAIKYNRDSGSVSLRCEDAKDNKVRISVTDTGTGMTPEQQKDLFKPFYRLGLENSGVEGTGIGLSLTKRLVELMDGQIGFTSTPGQGSTFWIEIALSDVDQVPTHDFRQPETDTSGDRLVLYVEDNPANQRLMEQIIDRIDGLKVMIAHTAELGIEMAEAHDPDLIILDINLPGIDGFEALKILQAKSQFARTPVLALSANAMARDIKKGKQAGFLDYLTKPIKIEPLVAAIEQALGCLDDDNVVTLQKVVKKERP
ncbi:MAG: ATP-binding protein [Alphaproteobacteria bacterium]